MITYAFAHAGYAHLIGNMWVLWCSAIRSIGGWATVMYGLTIRPVLAMGVSFRLVCEWLLVGSSGAIFAVIRSPFSCHAGQVGRSSATWPCFRFRSCGAVQRPQIGWFWFIRWDHFQRSGPVGDPARADVESGGCSGGVGTGPISAIAGANVRRRCRAFVTIDHDAGQACAAPGILTLIARPLGLANRGRTESWLTSNSFPPWERPPAAVQPLGASNRPWGLDGRVWPLELAAVHERGQAARRRGSRSGIRRRWLEAGRGSQHLAADIDFGSAAHGALCNLPPELKGKTVRPAFQRYLLCTCTRGSPAIAAGTDLRRIDPSGTGRTWCAVLAAGCDVDAYF